MINLFNRIELNETPTESDLDPTHYTSYYAYFNESALKTKDRNNLPDEAFGIPRLRMYPLHDEAHVKQAIRMFGHCKDPKDRTTLAKNIEKAIKKFNITVKIGKNNPLYSYIDKSLTEASFPQFGLSAIAKPLEKRTEKEIVAEHIRLNSGYYNNIFYGTAYGKALAAHVKEAYPFVEFFYPDMRRMNFYTRLQCVCGGLASSRLMPIVYDFLKIRPPIDADYTKEIGFIDSERRKEIEDNAIVLTSMGTNYDPDSNWFKVDLSEDLDHTIYCLELYSIMGRIFLNPYFTVGTELAAGHHMGILTDWQQRVSYHYDLYKDAKPDSKEQLREMQYLFDLFWSFTDNPYSEEAICANTIWMFKEMACEKSQMDSMNEANIPGELITREKCSAYLVHDLGMPDDIFLLPGSLEYPILDKSSVLLAMDNIRMVPKESQREYARNLNRRYKELGCTFSITVDHPYAKFADQNIIDKMSRVLLEGETVVDDEKSSDEGFAHDHETKPWHRKIDTNDALRQNLADRPDDSANTKKIKEPEFSPFDAVL